MIIFLVLAANLVIIGFGVAGLFAPRSLAAWVQWFDNLRGLVLAAVVRILFGLALIDIAPASQWPNSLLWIGLFTVAAGVILLLMGVKRFHDIAAWWCGQSNAMLRVWSAGALLLGAWLVVAVWSVVVG